MTYDPKIHHRRSIRLKGYDYSQEGAYFLTVCTHQKKILFGTIENETMHLNEAGEQALQCWNEIPDHFPNVELDEFIIMPNHIHGIIVIVGANNHSPDSHDPVGAKNISPDCDESVGAKNISPPHDDSVRANNHSPLQSDAPARPRGTSKTVGSIVRGFKIGVTKWMRNPPARANNDSPLHDESARANNDSPLHHESVRANNDSPLHNAPYGRKIFRPYMAGPVWHRNFYEHIIRDEPELFRIRKYILENPAQWYWDKLNPDNTSGAVRESDAAYGMETWMV